MKIGVKGAIAAINAFREATHGNVVTIKTVEARAAVCEACPKKQEVQPGDLVARASKTLGTLSGKHGVPDEIAKKKCGVCKCSLLLLLPAKRENLHKDSAKEAASRPASCWISQPDEPTKGLR